MHSPARNGPRDPSSRDLAWEGVRWARALRPDLITLENVAAWLRWGPLDERGYPIEGRAGETFRAFVLALRGMGYRVAWRELRACDFGAPTTRPRLYLVARRDGRRVCWPRPTHGPGGVKPHRRAADYLDFDLPCHPVYMGREAARIYGREHGVRLIRPLATATLSRIESTIRHRVTEAEPDEMFTRIEGGQRVAYALLVYYTGARRGASVLDPLPTITAGSERFGLLRVPLERPQAVGLRLLTPEELARLQGWPEGYRLDAAHTKADRTRCVGNSVSPPPLAAILRANRPR